MSKCIAIALYAALAAFSAFCSDDTYSGYSTYDVCATASVTCRTDAVREIKRVERRGKKLGIELNRKKMEKLKGDRIVAIVKEYDRVIAILETLPPDFVKACKIESIWFSDDIMDASGSVASGFASGEGINLTIGASEGTIYHEIFHKFENRISSSQRRKWEKLNPEKFIYEGSGWDEFAGNDKRSRKKIERQRKRIAQGKEKSAKERLEESRSKKESSRIAANRLDGSVQAAFINGYAQTTPAEDRAEVFRAMLCEGPRFMDRVRASVHMRAKMEFMVKCTQKYLGADFWDRKLGNLGDGPNSGGRCDNAGRAMPGLVLKGVR